MIARHGWLPGFQQIPTLGGSHKIVEWPIRKLRHRHFEMCRQLAPLLDKGIRENPATQFWIGNPLEGCHLP